MMKINNWEDLITFAKEQKLTPQQAWERIEKANIKFLNRKSEAEKELKKGTKIQKLMFPKIDNDENIIFAKNLPSLDISGDFYNFKNYGDKTFIALGDVSGKGVDAGLIMARVTALFEILVEEKKNISQIVSLINDNLCSLHSGKFLTGIFVSYDKKTKDLEYINAGHLNCIVSENQKITEYISKKTQPLGIEPFNSELKTNLNQISLEKKIFYLFSDGLYESKDFEGKEIKIDGLINLINKNKEYSLDKQLDNIFIEISTFGALQNILEEEKSIFGNIVSDQIEKYKSEDFFEKEKSIIKDDITIFAINGE